MIRNAVCIALLAGIAGCGDSGDAGEADTVTRFDVPDPAMEQPPETALGRPVKVDVLPDSLTLDEEGERIFVPDMGWLPLQEFWHIYDTNPARFPESLDYRAVHQIRLSLADKDHDEA